MQIRRIGPRGTELLIPREEGQLAASVNVPPVKVTDLSRGRVCALTHPLPQVVCQQQVAGEVVGEGRVELQNLLQGIALDDMEVTVRQGSYVSAGLGEGHFLPEHVAKYVPLPWSKDRASLVNFSSSEQNQRQNLQ